jgi:hypothetical protein
MGTAADRQAQARRWRYAAALDALAVQTNPRYRPNQRGQGETYCNLFVADATAALGAPVPLYQAAPDGRRTWLDANAMHTWLATVGATQGWRTVSAAAAQRLANQGRPVVASWRNPAGAGHLAMVRPGPEPLGAGGPCIAQAGGVNYAAIDLATGFGGGAARLAAVVYFAHAPGAG